MHSDSDTGFSTSLELPCFLCRLSSSPPPSHCSKRLLKTASTHIYHLYCLLYWKSEKHKFLNHWLTDHLKSGDASAFKTSIEMQPLIPPLSLTALFLNSHSCIFIASLIPLSCPLTKQNLKWDCFANAPSSQFYPYTIINDYSILTRKVWQSL